MSDHVLYRMYDAHGALLYVGLTTEPKSRIRAHEHDKQWWPQVATISLEHFPSKSELRSAERRAVETERPLYNQNLRLFSTAWCRQQGHVTPGSKKCTDCREGTDALEMELAEEESDRYLSALLADDPITRSILGLNRPDEQQISAEEIRSSDSWRRFEECVTELLAPEAESLIAVRVTDPLPLSTLCGGRTPAPIPPGAGTKPEK